MVRGLDRFRSVFAAYPDSFVLIGGTACHLAMAQAGSVFRVTHDFDIVLCLEQMDANFGRTLWRFIADGGYAAREKHSGGHYVYRFHRPTDDSYPAMLELFSRLPDDLAVPPGSTLTPIPMGEDVSSLSAILLDDAYYGLVQAGRQIHEGLPFLAAEYLVPLKARAWLDLTNRRTAGETLDSADIRKHRNDCLRLVALIPGDRFVSLPASVRLDLERFIAAVSTADVQPRSLGLGNIRLADLVDAMRQLYLG
jgi:hypothetical protein